MSVLGKSEPVYVVLTASGRVWSGKPGVMTWFCILDAIHNEFMSAGGSWDRPDKLIVNGTVVVERGLADVAYAYGQKSNKERWAAAARVQDEFRPDWYAALQSEASA